MITLREENPKSFTEFVSLVEKYQKLFSGELWYRGCGRADYKLVPSLYRHNTETTIDKIAILEQQLMTRFRQRSIPLQTRSLVDDWDTLFFMQHYRIPTRLLDWTENPFIALHFAVMSAEFSTTKTSGLKFKKPAAVWLMNPVIWNRKALSHQSYNGGVLVAGDEPLKGYQPRETFTGMNNFPVAIYGAHNSPRIVAQRGVFVIFGQNVLPMESLYTKESFPESSLIKIVLSVEYLPDIRKAVLNHGITESVVYPDFEGLAMEMRRNFGFEV